MASASCNPQNAFSDYQIGGEDYSSYPPTLGKTSGASGGGTETRPRNVALLACIKY